MNIFDEQPAKNPFLFSLKEGERVVVGTNQHVKATVEKVTWMQEEHRYRVDLDWGEFGKSRVFSDDEGKTWYRYSSSN